MPLPLTVSCFSKIQIGFTYLVPAHPGSPGKRAVKRVCVCIIFGTWCTPSFPVVLSVSGSNYSVSLFSLLRQPTTWHCPHSPVARCAAVSRRRRRRCCGSRRPPRSIDVSRQPGLQHASKLAADGHGQTDGRTDGRTSDSCIDPAAHAVRSIPIARRHSNLT